MRVYRKTTTPLFQSSVPPVLDIDRAQAPVAFAGERRPSEALAAANETRPGRVSSGDPVQHPRQE